MPNNCKNIRKCIVCHEHAEKKDLIRFVKVNSEVVLDSTQKIDGRGVWVHNNTECIQKLIKKKILNASFKMNLSDDIYKGLLNE